VADKRPNRKRQGANRIEDGAADGCRRTDASARAGGGEGALGRARTRSRGSAARCHAVTPNGSFRDLVKCMGTAWRGF